MKDEEIREEQNLRSPIGKGAMEHVNFLFHGQKKRLGSLTARRYGTVGLNITSTK